MLSVLRDVVLEPGRLQLSSEMTRAGQEPSLPIGGQWKNDGVSGLSGREHSLHGGLLSRLHIFLLENGKKGTPTGSNPHPTHGALLYPEV